MNDKRLVYSTDGPRAEARTPTKSTAPTGKRQAAKPTQAPALPQDGVVRIFREKGNRGGKTVTVVRGLPQRGADLATLTGELKRLCGAGGTVREGAIEVQGDHRERIAEHLRGLSYQVKLAGG